MSGRHQASQLGREPRIRLREPVPVERRRAEVARRADAGRNGDIRAEGHEPWRARHEELFRVAPGHPGGERVDRRTRDSALQDGRCGGEDERPESRLVRVDHLERGGARGTGRPLLRPGQADGGLPRRDERLDAGPVGREERPLRGDPPEQGQDRVVPGEERQRGERGGPLTPVGRREGLPPGQPGVGEITQADRIHWQ